MPRKYEEQARRINAQANQPKVVLKLKDRKKWERTKKIGTLAFVIGLSVAVYYLTIFAISRDDRQNQQSFENHKESLIDPETNDYYRPDLFRSEDDSKTQDTGKTK